MTEFQVDRETTFIDKPEDFDKVCGSLLSVPLIALDTEFIRTSTFYPKPGLVQITAGEGIFLIDPVKVKSWEKFCQLLAAGETIVIMHSCSEDLSLLQHMMQSLPGRLFDTQRAAAFLGLGYSISYQGLVKSELGLEIPKGETRSDWLQRPLTQQQLNYAALDVAYLIPLYTLLKEKLHALGRSRWLELDCAEMLLQVKDETCEADWAQYYTAISGAWKLDGDQLDLLQRLCFWREVVARERDRPRNWILKDNELLALADAVESRRKSAGTDCPYDSSMVVDAQVLSTKFANREADLIVKFLNSGKVFEQPAHIGSVDKPLSAPQRQILKQCQQLAQIKSEQLGIAPELLARKRQWLEMLHRLHRGCADIWPVSLSGWRKEVLEQEVLVILDGKRK